MKDWRAKLTAMCISIHRLKCLKRLMKTGLHIQIPSKTSGETLETSPSVIASGSVLSTKTHIHEGQPAQLRREQPVAKAGRPRGQLDQQPRAGYK